MMFNNNFTKEGKIKFNPNEWTCTDPDEWQFCRKIDETEYEYIQLKDKELVRDSLCCGKLGLEYLNEKTTPSDWWQEEIDITDYTEDEKGDYIIESYFAPYGYKETYKDWSEEDRNQLLAECIFETDIVCGEII